MIRRLREELARRGALVMRHLREALARSLAALARHVDWPYAEGTDWKPLTGGPAPAYWDDAAPCAAVQPTLFDDLAGWRPLACSRPRDHLGPWHAASDGERVVGAWTDGEELWVEETGPRT